MTQTHIYYGRDDILLKSESNILENPYDRHIMYCPYEAGYFLEYAEFSSHLHQLPADHPLRSNLYHVFLEHKPKRNDCGPEFSQEKNWSTYYMHFSINRFITENSSLAQNTNPEYLYCCLNRRPKIHRAKTILALDNLNLMHKGKVTWLTTQEEVLALEHLVNFRPEWQPYLERLKHMNFYSEPIKSSHNTVWIYQNLDVYTNCLFDIVTESESDKCVWSEKTTRPLLFGKPFVLMGSPDNNTELVTLGYEPYTDFFDITQTDYEKILCGIADISESEYASILLKLQDKIEHNRATLIKNLFDDDLIPDIVWEIPEQHNKFLHKINSSRECVQQHSELKRYI